MRPYLLQQSNRLALSIRRGNWKLLDHKGSGGNRYDRGVMKAYALAEAAPDAPGQLYDLASDPGETANLYHEQAERRREMQELLARLKSSGRSAPTGRKPIGIEAIRSR